MPLSLPPWLRHLADDAAELVFPRACLTCARPMPREQPGLACDTCWGRVRSLPFPRCARCGHPGEPAACHWCHRVEASVTLARSWCWADDPVGSTLIHGLKYHGWRNLAAEIALRLSRLDLGAVSPDAPRVFVPVPLAPRRLRERGFNQSERLARALATCGRGCVATDLLGRVRETPTQTRLTPAQRLTNVADAFRGDASRVSGHGNAAFVLVDDVITTGATLNACAAALARAGARTICFITFGRARDPRDAPPTRGTSSHGHSGRH